MYLVVFRNRKRAGLDAAAYGEAAARMERLAQAQPGYLSFKSFVADEGAGDVEHVAISEWESEAAARAWGRQAEHRAAQADGRARWYAEYTLFGCDSPQIHRFREEQR